MVYSTSSSLLLGEGGDDGEVWLCIGPPHRQTDREIEILVNVCREGRESVVFHSMELGPKFYRCREESPNA